MNKILYIGNDITLIKTGADSVNKRNIYFLKQIFGDKLIIKSLKNENSILEKLNFYLAGLNAVTEDEIISILADEDVQYVFLSQSLLGRVAKKIKKRIKRKITIITFYHNIEIHYAKEFIKISGINHYPFYWLCLFNEKKATKYSDINIVLNKRDADKLFERYNVNAEIILPASFEDKFTLNKIVTHKLSPPIYLFVGVAFFANLEGISWFIQNVLPHTPGVLKIIGKDMNLYENDLNSEKVEVLGYVDDLSYYYYNSTVVIAPIFSGGGMKTKIAEALMYGKTIVGTDEAFQGYVENDKAMMKANDKGDFINILNSTDFNSYNNESRICFTGFYSNDIQLNEFKKIFL